MSSDFTQRSAVAPVDGHSPSQRYGGWALSGLLGLFLLFDGAQQLIPAQFVLQSAEHIGWTRDAALWRPIGAVVVVSTLLYLWPRGALVGAIILTGFLGGAIAASVRVEGLVSPHILFIAALIVALWAGLWLRDPRLRALTR